MPFLLNKNNRCAVSGKLIKHGDRVVAFPVYESHPGEPEYVCSENIALRDEFENWQYKDRVVSKVRMAWVSWYRSSTSYSILWDDDSFLIVKSLLENKLRIFFLNHVFAVEVVKEKWEEFQHKLTIGDGQIVLRANASLSWMASPPYTNLLLVDNEWKDSVNILSSDWERLVRFFSSKNSSLSTHP